MILTAHQPVYLPWLGLFHKIALADKFCIFDIAQYQTKDFNNRNKIKTNAGSLWLSVPVESKEHFQKSVKDIKIINNGWNKKHFKTIDLAYRKSQFYEDYIWQLESILLKKNYVYLADLNLETLNFGLQALGINIPIETASAHNFKGRKSDLVLDMCKELGADHYIFGSQGNNYADVETFLDAGITPHFQSYIHPTYKQLHGDFEPYMSVIDLLFNAGSDSLNILMGDNISSVVNIDFSKKKDLDGI